MREDRSGMYRPAATNIQVSIPEAKEEKYCADEFGST